MNSAEKINPSAPCMIQLTRTSLSKTDKKSIGLIKRKYGFKENLAMIIESLPNVAISFNDFYRQNGRT